MGEGLAELAKGSGLVFQADGEFFGDGHGGNLLLLHLGRAGKLLRGDTMRECYACMRLTARFAEVYRSVPVKSEMRVGFWVAWPSSANFYFFRFAPRRKC